MVALWRAVAGVFIPPNGLLVATGFMLPHAERAFRDWTLVSIVAHPLCRSDRSRIMQRSRDNKRVGSYSMQRIRAGSSKVKGKGGRGPSTAPQSLRSNRSFRTEVNLSSAKRISVLIQSA